MRNPPLISVIMGVYNTKIEYLRSALDSIWNQTYQNWEFIVIDDASDKWCTEFLYQYSDDNRFKIYRNETNRGLTACLNTALRMAEGKYIARMDSDDICAPNRLERQIAYMEKHEDVDVLACSTYIYDGTGGSKFSGIHRKFVQERIRVRLSMANIEFPHPTVVFRHDFLQRNHLNYDESIKKAQDYNMWMRCIERGKLECLQDVLFISRMHEAQISSNAQNQREYADITKIKCLKRLLPDSTDRQEYLYTHRRDMELGGSEQENIELVQALINANDKLRVYKPDIYRQEIFFWWLRKCMYQENRSIGKQILHNNYMKKNIARIFIPQCERCVTDKPDNKRITFR